MEIYLDFGFKSLVTWETLDSLTQGLVYIVLGIVFKLTGASMGPEQSKVPQKCAPKKSVIFLFM